MAGPVVHGFPALGKPDAEQVPVPFRDPVIGTPYGKDRVTSTLDRFADNSLRGLRSSVHFDTCGGTQPFLAHGLGVVVGERQHASDFGIGIGRPSEQPFEAEPDFLVGADVPHARHIDGVELLNPHVLPVLLPLNCPEGFVALSPESGSAGSISGAGTVLGSSVQAGLRRPGTTSRRTTGRSADLEQACRTHAATNAHRADDMLCTTSTSLDQGVTDKPSTRHSIRMPD